MTCDRRRIHVGDVHRLLADRDDRGGPLMWVKLDDRMPFHPKVAGLSDRAFREFIVSLAYSCQYLTDGFVPDSLLPRKKIVHELVEAGLWDLLEETNGTRRGILIHDFLEYQPSRDEKNAEKLAKISGKSRAGRVRAATAIRAEDGTFVGTNRPVVLDDAGRAAGPNAGSSEAPLIQQASSPVPVPVPVPQEQNLARRVPRPRDEVFEATAEVCGIDWHNLTKRGRDALNGAVEDLKSVGATPDEIRRRAANWPFRIALTPSGFAKHYPSLGTARGDAGRVGAEAIMQIAAQMDAAGGEF